MKRNSFHTTKTACFAFHIHSFNGKHGVKHGNSVCM